jgi:hypothetical protein
MLASLRGPRVTGPLAPELPVTYAADSRYASVTAIPLTQVTRTLRDASETQTAVEER